MLGTGLSLDGLAAHNPAAKRIPVRRTSTPVTRPRTAPQSVLCVVSAIPLRPSPTLLWLSLAVLPSPSFRIPDRDVSPMSREPRGFATYVQTHLEAACFDHVHPALQTIHLSRHPLIFFNWSHFRPRCGPPTRGVKQRYRQRVDSVVKALAWPKSHQSMWDASGTCGHMSGVPPWFCASKAHAAASISKEVRSERFESSLPPILSMA
jgi:hypothetical protein